MNLKHAAFSVFSRLNGAFGAGTRGLRVLMYHSVGGTLSEDPYGTSISKARFKDHLARYDALRGEFPAAAFGVPKTTEPAVHFCFDDGYRDTLTAAAPLLAARSIPFTVFVAAEHVDKPGGLYLDRKELKELASVPGARIGAHGNRHVPLTGLSDEALAEDLAASRSRLEDWLEEPVRAMSYPHGAVDRRVRDAAEKAGFSLAGCSLYGTNLPGRDPLLLKRTEIVAYDDADDFELKLRGHWDWFALRQGDPAA